MKKLILIFALTPLMAFAQYGQRGAGGGSTFYWSLTGQAQKTDSLRIIQGTNMTITQSGNTVTFNGAAGAGSTANVRANTGWTSNGTLARDTLATNYAIFGAKTFGVGGTTQAQNARAKFNVLGRAANDTLAIFSNDGGGLVGDSSIVFTGNSKILIGGGSATAAGNINGAGSYISLNAGSAPYVDFLMGTLGAAGTRHFRFMTQSQGGAETGYFGFNRVNNTSTFVNPRALVDFRSSKPVADTLLIVSNDGNATLDSTFMVFANGRILRCDTKALPAGAWLATASNGAALSSSNYMVTYAFDTATAETLTVDFALPPNFMQVSNVEIEVVSPNTDGDSVGFAIAWLGRAADEALNVAFSSPLSGQIDLGTTANVRKILTISGTFDNLAASDRLIFKLWRDPSVDNDVAADVHLVDVRVNGNGLLY